MVYLVSSSQFLSSIKGRAQQVDSSKPGLMIVHPPISNLTFQPEAHMQKFVQTLVLPVAPTSPCFGAF